MSQILDSNDPNQVASARHIEAELGAETHRLLIFSGIARPERRVADDEHLYPLEVIVRLGVAVGVLAEYTVQAGLASVGNDETTFVFAVDASRLEVDPRSQELLLHVETNLQGDWSALNRFGYQVVALVDTVATAIRGEVRWATSIFDAASVDQQRMNTLMRAQANRIEMLPQDPPWAPQEKLIPLATGTFDAPTSFDGGWKAKYEITGVPFEEPLRVTLSLATDFVRARSLSVEGGPYTPKLTLSQPEATACDFRISDVVIK